MREFFDRKSHDFRYDKMQLYYFLAVVLSLSVGSLPESNHSFTHAAGFTALVILAWWTLSYLAVRLVVGLIRDGEVNADVGYDWFHRQTECLRWFSLGLVLLCLGGFGLGRNLNQLPYLQHTLAGQSLLLMFPATAMMCGLWAGEYLFAVRLGYARGSFLHGLGWVGSALRCQIGLLLIPILGFMLIIDLASVTSIGNHIPAWAGWVALTVAVVVGLPLMFRRVFPTKSIDQATKHWIETVVASAGIRSCKIVIWNTGDRNHNAMIAGLLGRFRILLLSDRLVADLSRDELSMVILHEVAHAKRCHIPLRIAALVPAWVLGGAFEFALRRYSSADWAADWAGMIGCSLSILATVLILRWVSYRSEFDADTVACRLAPQVALRCEGVPVTVFDASRSLASALLRVTAECDASRRPTWLHPGIADRINAFAPAA